MIFFFSHIYLVTFPDSCLVHHKFHRERHIFFFRCLGNNTLKFTHQEMLKDLLALYKIWSFRIKIPLLIVCLFVGFLYAYYSVSLRLVCVIKVGTI